MTDLEGLRIGLLTASASRLGGGVFEAVVQQAELITARGGIAPVFALHDAYAGEDARRFAPAPVSHAAVVGPAMVGLAPGLVKTLIAARLDCLHLHGIWMYPSHAGAAWAARTGGAYVVSPHGMLAPWIVARGRAKKRIARLAYERASWRRANVLHALTPSEADDIARESGRADACVIPNAAPPLAVPCAAMPGLEFLFIGRIHPKKNLGALITAWTASGAAESGARLRIAGWGAERDVEQLRAMIAAAGDSAEFLGPVYGEAKADLLRAARFVVLPSLSEGLPMAILEAWSAGVPTVMSRACNLDDGFAAGAALDCGTEVAAIAAALRRALALSDEEWRAMAGAARALAAGAYAARTVADTWVQCYRAAIGDAARKSAA